MNFMDAVNNMQAGKKLSRLGWSGYYLVILSTQKYIWSIENGTDKPIINAGLYTPRVDDISATDWMIKP